MQQPRDRFVVVFRLSAAGGVPLHVGVVPLLGIRRALEAREIQPGADPAALVVGGPAETIDHGVGGRVHGHGIGHVRFASRDLHLADLHLAVLLLRSPSACGEPRVRRLKLI